MSDDDLFRTYSITSTKFESDSSDDDGKFYSRNNVLGSTEHINMSARQQEEMIEELKKENFDLKLRLYDEEKNSQNIKSTILSYDKKIEDFVIENEELMKKNFSLEKGFAKLKAELDQTKQVIEQLKEINETNSVTIQSLRSSLNDKTFQKSESIISEGLIDNNSDQLTDSKQDKASENSNSCIGDPSDSIENKFIDDKYLINTTPKASYEEDNNDYKFKTKKQFNVNSKHISYQNKDQIKKTRPQNKSTIKGLFKSMIQKKTPDEVD